MRLITIFVFWKVVSLDSKYRDELASLIWIISVASTGNLLSMKTDTTEVRCLLH